VVLSLFLEGEVVLGGAALRLLQADDLLCTGCIQTLVEHLPLVVQFLAVHSRPLAGTIAVDGVTVGLG
jgi:hypothetical protein